MTSHRAALRVKEDWKVLCELSSPKQTLVMISPSCYFPKSREGLGAGFGSQTGLLCNSHIQIMQGWKVNFLHVCFFQTTWRRRSASWCGSVKCWLLTAPGGPGPYVVGNWSAWEEGLWSFLFYFVCLSEPSNIWNKYLLAHNGLEHMLACFRGCKSKNTSGSFHSRSHSEFFGFLYTRHRLYNYWHLLSILQLIKKV